LFFADDWGYGGEYYRLPRVLFSGNSWDRDLPPLAGRPLAVNLYTGEFRVEVPAYNPSRFIFSRMALLPHCPGLMTDWEIDGVATVRLNLPASRADSRCTTTTLAEFDAMPREAIAFLNGFNRLDMEPARPYVGNVILVHGSKVPELAFDPNANQEMHAVVVEEVVMWRRKVYLEVRKPPALGRLSDADNADNMYFFVPFELGTPMRPLAEHE
jgi:hypothetical protein